MDNTSEGQAPLTPAVAELIRTVEPIMAEARRSKTPSEVNQHIHRIRALVEPVRDEHMNSTDPEHWKTGEALQKLLDGIQEAIRYEAPNRPNSIGDF